MLFECFVLLVIFIRCDRDVHPIIFSGGLGGQGLEAKLDHAPEPHWWCHKNDDWFRIWMNIVEEVPHLTLGCFENNIKPRFDPVSKTYSNAKGVSIRPADFGGMGSVEYLSLNPAVKEKSDYMHSWLTYFEQYGYKSGVSFRSAPYDWRFGPMEWRKNEDWGFPALKKLVEATYKLNGNKKVHLMGHSLGSPYLGYFLSSFPTQDWKDQYIASFISLGGPLDGSFLAAYLNIVGTNFYQPFKVDENWLQVLKQIGGSAWMTPQFYLMDKPFMFTKTRNYTLNQLDELMKDANSTISYEIYEWEKQGLKNNPPGVKTYCMYGVNVPTAYSFYIDDLMNPLKPNSTSFISSGDGDSVVHFDSLKICDEFKTKQEQDVIVMRYPGVLHSPMVKNQTIWDDVLKITAPEISRV